MSLNSSAAVFVENLGCSALILHEILSLCSLVLFSGHTAVDNVSSSVMLARPALFNCSIFKPDGKGLPLKEVLLENNNVGLLNC